MSIDKAREKKPLPSGEDIQRRLQYDALRGVLVWRERDDVAAHVNARLAGKDAGAPNTRGYIQVELCGTAYMAHLLIFKMLHGRDPIGDVDHKDGDVQNNRAFNLREATHQQNGWNSRAPGPWKKGVSFHRRDRRFYAAITLPSRKRKFLGSFATEDEAHSAYMDAARSHFGEFARAA